MGQGKGFLAVDVGTTHSKAALFGEDGALVHIAMCHTDTVTYRDMEVYDPEALWNGIAGLIREVVSVPGAPQVAGIGITSMAESGLLVDRDTGKALSPFIPWFSPVTQPQAEHIAAQADPFDRFVASGLKPSPKYGLPKLLWIQEHVPEALNGGGRPVWLSASDYIAFRLTGQAATDYTLAARTYAYRIDEKRWDEDWIRHFGLDPAIFPEAQRSGEIVGRVLSDRAGAFGLPSEVPVVIGGHDHVCSALAAGAVTPETMMDSMGTAETLVGMMGQRALTRDDYESGFSFGAHVVPDAMFWMGSITFSGGSVEWLRGQLNDNGLSYEQILSLLAGCKQEPTGVLFYPYLSGSGAPKRDAKAKAAFIGLQAAHTRAELIKAVLEGTAYEMEFMREAAAKLTGKRHERVTVVGGGTKNRFWLEIKASVSDVTLLVPKQHETALLGAAILAAAASGVYGTLDEARTSMASQEGITQYSPDANLHQKYRTLYENGYLALQEPIRAFSKLKLY
ncbi:FGGY-family carbohydrate kinase [Paenibacillus turpanensis]|uniref:FGGY-family carbohydrate kinase n=1 Tax=Paenibacillus turpanensis TaxID=2689078 RepID=UPI0014096D24|nr:FGGY family carbohydrate kinase [Paenibacillus turpanensis]